LHTESGRQEDEIFNRYDSNDDLNSQKSYNPAASSLVHVPNQSNAFFASGFKMINPVHGDLERMYQTTYSRKPSADENNQSKLLKTYEEGRPEIDRTQHILKCLKDKTPGMTDINRGKIRRINHQAQNKVAYAYKERFCGIYEDRKRAGQLTRENSWEKFVNPAKVGINNYIQHALNSEAAEQLKDTQGNNQEDEQPKIEIGADNKDGKESAFDTGRSSK